MKKTFHEKFTDFADWVSSAMGTPENIIAWLGIVGAWFLLFALFPNLANSNFLPSWFTSNTFNFPLNSITTLAELYIGFLIAAAANRVEKRNWQLHQNMMKLLEMIEAQEKEELDHMK